jgi:hypothetical protein
MTMKRFGVLASAGQLGRLFPLAPHPPAQPKPQPVFVSPGNLRFPSNDTANTAEVAPTITRETNFCQSIKEQ